MPSQQHSLLEAFAINASYSVILASQLMRSINQTPEGEAFLFLPWTHHVLGFSASIATSIGRSLEHNYWIKVQVAKVLLTYSSCKQRALQAHRLLIGTVWSADPLPDVYISWWSPQAIIQKNASVSANIYNTFSKSIIFTCRMCAIT